MGISDIAREWGHEQVVFCHDQDTGLRAIIAIHDTTLGPALGGCRFWNYATEEEAVFDVMRLSRGMTYKAAVAGLSLGGGKSVIIGDPAKLKNEQFFRVFGRFVNSLGGRYITAEDVNIRVEDMNQVAMETPYVTGVSTRPGGSGDPSPVTALGVFAGVKAAARFHLKKESLVGLRVAVQGVGSVGSYLCGYLHEAGAKLMVSDLNAEATQKMERKYGATVVRTEDIHKQDVDVYAPCALGAILNEKTIPELKATIVAGGANNQLLDEVKDGQRLKARSILYAPDYVINAGGLINVSYELRGYDAEAAKRDAGKIYDTLLEVFKEAASKDITTLQASNEMAQARLNKARKAKDTKLVNTFNNQHWIKIRSNL